MALAAGDETAFDDVTAAPAAAGRWWERVARSRLLSLLGPILLVTIQVFLDYRHLELPAGFIARHPHDPHAYHRLLTDRGVYSDLYTLFWHHHLYRHPIPYVDIRIEYPVVIGLYMTAAAALTTGVREYFLLSSVGLYACAIGSVCCLWALSRRAAWIFSICPLLLIFSLLNWDMLAIFFMLLGWYSWQKERYGQAALWLSIGTFTKAYPFFLLLFCLLALVRRWRRREVTGSSLLSYVGLSVAVAVVLNLPFILIDERRWAYFFVLNQERNQRVSIFYWFHLLHHSSSRALVNDTFTALVLVVLALGSYAIWRGLNPAKVAAVAFALFLLGQKVYSPQYTLWLIPLALIAEWDLWTIAALSIVGLADYSSASLNIFLELHANVLSDWYSARIVPFNRDVRLAVISAVALAAVVKPLWLRHSRKPQLGPRAPSPLSP